MTNREFAEIAIGKINRRIENLKVCENLTKQHKLEHGDEIKNLMSELEEINNMVTKDYYFSDDKFDVFGQSTSHLVNEYTKKADDLNKIIMIESEGACLINYDGYIIKASPDYRTKIKNGDEVILVDCEVYAQADSEMRNRLTNFNMMKGYEFKEDTEESIESGIQSTIDEEYAFLDLAKKENAKERAAELFNNALDYLSELANGEELYNILTNSLGMTNEEIEEYGIDYLDEFYENEQDGGMNMC